MIAPLDKGGLGVYICGAITKWF